MSAREELTLYRTDFTAELYQIFLKMVRTFFYKEKFHDGNWPMHAYNMLNRMDYNFHRKKGN